MKVEIDLPEIEGFEYTGEYREPEINEFYQGGNGVYDCSRVGLGSYPILKQKVPAYRTVESKPETTVGEVVKYVEIKALVDALTLGVTSSEGMTNSQCDMHIELMELIK